MSPVPCSEREGGKTRGTDRNRLTLRPGGKQGALTVGHISANFVDQIETPAALPELSMQEVALNQ